MEVYFVTKRSMIILNQRNIWACASVAMLGALKRMKPEIDHVTLLQEVLLAKESHLTYQRAAAWFQKKWLIKWIKPVKYSPFILRKQPLLTWLVNVDWNKTAEIPYNLTFQDRDTLWSHFVYIDSPGRIVNSYWESWWDNGCFYFKQNQIRNMKQMVAIIL